MNSTALDNPLFADAHARQRILLISVLWAVFVFAVNTSNPVLSPYVKSQGFSNEFLSALFAVNPLVVIFLSHFVGALSDQVGRTRIMFVGLVAQTLAFLIYLFTPTWYGVIAARVLEAAAVALLTVTAVSKVQDYAREGKRGATGGLVFSLETMGALLGPVFGAFLAQSFFVTMPLAASIAILLLLSVFALTQIDWNRKRGDVTKDTVRKDFTSSVREFLSVRELRAMALLGGAMHASTPAILIFVPLFVLENLKGSYADVGLFFFFLASISVFQAFTGRLSDRFGSKNAITFGTSLAGLSLFILSWANSLGVLFAAALIRSAGSALWNVSAWSFMSEIGEKKGKEGLVVGSYFSLAQVGAFLSFLASGWIVTSYGFSALFAFNGALIILVTILVKARYF